MEKSYKTYEFYDAAAASRVTELSRDGVIFTFIYSGSLLYGGERRQYDTADPSVRIIVKEGVIYAPVRFFESFLGAAVTVEDDACSLSLGGRTATFPIYRSRGNDTLPLIEATRELGLLARTYYDGRLVAIGAAPQLDVLDSDEKMQVAAAYLTFGEYDPYSFSSADYRAAADKIKLRLVGSPELNDLSDPVIRGKIEAVDTAGAQAWRSMNKDEGRVILFGSMPPVESVELEIQYGGLRKMALAWGTCGTELYQNEQLKNDIIDGVRWMYENMYGEAEINGVGWRDAHAFNWYYWYISAGEFLTDIFFIMSDCFSLDERRRYLECFNWCSTFMRHWFERNAALSRISVCTKVGIACEDPERLRAEFVDYDMLLGYEELLEGPHVDYSQWTHGMAYNNAYGKLNLDRVLRIAASLSGTALEFSSPKQYNQFMLAKYMFEPAMYKGQAFISFCGRDVHYKEAENGGEILAGILTMHGVFGEDEDEYIEAMVRRCADYPVVLKTLKRYATIPEAVLADRIMKRELQSEYEYAHAYYTADRAVLHRGDFAFAIAMSSKREKAYESINGANKTGWYTGDGATYLYTDYDRHQFDRDNFLLANEAIAYRYPGTTEDSRPRVARSIIPKREWIPKNAFAGAMQLRGKYLLAAMDYISQNSTAPDDMPDDSNEGGGQPVHHNDLVAKKAWFCFDDEIVCLGAGISSTMDSPVHTTLEHRRIVNRDADIQTVMDEGRRVVIGVEGYEKIHTGPDFVNINGHAGFVFPRGGDVLVHRYHRPDINNQDYIEIRIEHGKNPADSGYAYVILPRAEDARLAEYAKNPDIEILANTKQVQAVKERTTGYLMAAFYEQMELGNISVSAPCLLALRDEVLSICDPTHEAREITVRLEGELTDIKTPCAGARTLCADGKTIVTFNVENANGRSFTIEYGGKINV